MFTNAQEIEAFIRDFEARNMDKSRWTHNAHLLVGLWYLTCCSPDEALSIVRQRIRGFNEAVGTANTDNSGYHETLTRLFLHGIAAHIIANPNESLPSSLAILLQSPLAHKDWPLSFYSRERLFSVAARREWLEPDLRPDSNTCNAQALAIASGCEFARLQLSYIKSAIAEHGASHVQQTEMELRNGE
jgi:hypothetical protein